MIFNPFKTKTNSLIRANISNTWDIKILSTLTFYFQTYPSNPHLNSVDDRTGVTYAVKCGLVGLTHHNYPSH